jgi:two-component system cell cycle sensor histidine kinase PleC
LASGKHEPFDGQELFSGVVVDLTEQRNLRVQVELARQQERLNRRAARVLQERNEELEAISRSKDEFVALASHQLRTPATAVKQYIGMVLQGYVGAINEEQADVLTKAFESNERQIQIINQILSAARADTGRLVMMPMPIDLCSLIRGIVVDMDDTFRQRQHTLSLHLPKKPVRVAADLGYLRMAIENLLHNASVYTPLGGRVTVRITHTTRRCVVSIADTGVGIKKSDLGKLFVKFSRIHNPLSVEAGGSGIGLYLTAEIVRLHGGQINVESQVHKGSTFAISLPLMQNKVVDHHANE